MTISEFKHWLDGFAESIDGSPTKKQWDKIRKKLDSVYEATTAPSLPVYIPYHVPYYQRTSDRWWTNNNTQIPLTSTASEGWVSNSFCTVPQGDVFEVN